MTFQNFPDQTSFINFFDSVRIINMKKRLDRRRDTIKEFEHHAIPFVSPHVDFFEAITPNDAAGFPNIGVRGCFLSHLNILKSAQHRSIKNILILEDDIAFVKNMGTMGAKVVQELSELEWDIAYLGHALPSQPGSGRWADVNQPMLLAHCYAVNARVIPRLVAFLEEVIARPPGHPDGGPMHYDGALNTFLAQNKDVKAIYHTKNLAYQRPSKTDLHQVSFIDRSVFFKPFAALYRRFKQSILRWSH